MEFCQNCQTIIKNLFTRSHYEPALVPWSNTVLVNHLVQRFPFLSDYRQIFSIDGECRLCAFIQKALPSEDEARNLFATWPAQPFRLDIETRGGNGFRPASKNTGLQLSQMQVAMAYNIGLYNPAFSVTLSLTAVKGSVAATSGDVFGTNPLLNSSTSDALSILGEWFDECVSDHGKCIREKDPGVQKAIKPILPTRVLDTRPELDQMVIRLVEPHGIRDNYAALSHCWGRAEKRPLCTTKATFNDHISGIKLLQLPKTFQDAVAIVRAMKMRYLWIDSLCIIQDDLEDWSKEAPRMGTLYSNAELVIAASGASDSSEGCFLERIPPEPSINIPYVREDGSTDGHVQLNMKKYTEGKVAPEYEPLGKRGWVLQEWALARRIVHFTTKGIMWSCRTLGDRAIWENGHITTGTFSRNWNDIIDEFTTRDLTYLTDKLAAVEGIAHVMQGSRKDRYVSGMWTGDLPQQLFWVGRGTTRPPELQIFPTWSWASTHGPCVALVPKRISLDKIIVRCKSEINDASTLVLNGQSRQCVIMKAGLSLHEATQTPLFSGYRGPSSISILPWMLLNPEAHHVLHPKTRDIIGVAIPDDARDLGEWEHVCTGLLLMQEIDDSSGGGKKPIFLALLIRESSVAARASQRIGVAFIVDENFFETEDKCSFTIV